MNLLFIHQNFPAQFKSLARHLAAQPGHRVVALGDAQRLGRQPILPGVQTCTYPTPRAASNQTHSYLRAFEAATRRGQAVARACMALRKSGFEPDVIVAHPGWGEALFVKDVFPDTPVLGHFEFYYHARGSDVGFDPEFSATRIDNLLRVRVRNAHLLLSMHACDRGLAPTHWQFQQVPAELQSRTRIIHEGIDTAAIAPAPKAFVQLQRAGVRLTADDEVITYVSRNLEPYRGFHVFMRALPELLRRRPKAHVLIVGGDEVSYSPAPRTHKTYREMMLAEVGRQIDTSRVHFVGKLPYAAYLRVLQVSSAHLYLTYPFVLSWSMLEAMAAGCLVVGSNTAPVSEVIRHGHNGLLFDFFDQAQMLDTLDRALDDREGARALRQEARQTILERYDLQRVCLPAQVSLISQMANRARSAAPAPLDS